MIALIMVVHDCPLGRLLGKGGWGQAEAQWQGGDSSLHDRNQRRLVNSVSIQAGPGDRSRGHLTAGVGE